MQKNKLIFVSILILFSIASIFTAIASIFTASVSVTKLYVDPPSIINTKLNPGKNFTINISVSDVVDLYGYEFRLNYNTKILNVTDIKASSFLSSSLYCAKRVINDPEGYIWIACMRPLGTEKGVDGSGTLETITFLVTGKGESNLDLYKTVLGDHTGKAISHETIDGYFSNKVTKK